TPAKAERIRFATLRESVARLPETASSSSVTKSLIKGLSEFDFTQGKLATDQVTAINWAFKQIIEQGTNAIPAISEFLERCLDVNFAEIGNDIPLEYASLRLG